MKALLFVGLPSLWLRQASKPLVVVLDNASIYTAKAVRPLLELLECQGLTLCFPPPYCPELNRIEILRRKPNTSGGPFANTRGPMKTAEAE
ncbi:hypothetical protein GCM10027514_41680 [Azotobacter armeniacus]